MRNRWLSYSMIWLAIVLVAAYLNPNHYQPWPAFHADWLTGLAFAPLLIWSTTILPRQSIPPLSALAFVLGIFGVFQWSIGVIKYFGDCAIQLCYLAAFGLSIIAGRSLQINSKCERNGHGSEIASQGLWTAIVISGILSSGIAMYQIFELNYSAIFVMDIIDRSRAYANLAQPNQLATLLALAVVGGIAIFRKGIISRNTLIAVLAALSLGLATTKSRSTILFFLIFFSYTLVYKKWGRFDVSIAWPAFVMGLFVFFSIVIPEIRGAALLESGASILERTHVGSRIGILKMSFEAIPMMPLFGYGANQIAQAQLATLRDNQALNFVFESSHNLLIDFILNFGVPVGLAVTIIIAFWLIRSMCRIRSNEAFLLLLAISALGSHAMIEFPLNYAYFLLPIGFFIGQMDGHTNNYRIDISKTYKILYWMIICAFMVLAGALYVFISLDYQKIESKWRDMRYVLAKIQGSSVDFSDQPFVYNQFDDLIIFSVQSPRKNMPPGELQRMKIATYRFNLSAITFKYAVAAALNNQPTESAEAMLALCKMNHLRVCKIAIKDWDSYANEVWPELSSVNISDARALISGL